MFTENVFHTKNEKIGHGGSCWTTGEGHFWKMDKRMKKGDLDIHQIEDLLWRE